MVSEFNDDERRSYVPLPRQDPRAGQLGEDGERQAYPCQLSPDLSPVFLPPPQLMVSPNAPVYMGAWRVVLDAGFLRVCPIQPHFFRRICLATGSCPARSHSSSFRIFSGHRMLKMRLRQEFRAQRLLNRHMKNHGNVKRYLCVFCTGSFNDCFDLKRHTRTHTGVKPYKCEECTSAFTQRCSLEAHMTKLHGVVLPYKHKERRKKIYVCEDCGETAEKPETYLAHLRHYHPENPVLEKSHDKRQFNFNDKNDKKKGKRKALKPKN
nr:hypothetical protein BaRGS_019951 [Batillaria attramentaria]